MRGAKYRPISDENKSNVEIIGAAEKERLRGFFEASGAIRTGFTTAGEVPEQLNASLRKWLREGCHASMDWMKRHAGLRRSSVSVMPEAATVIVCAFSYLPAAVRDPHEPHISSYALGLDYHDVLRRRLQPVCRQMELEYGCRTRICIDSAPLEERYFALRAGIGKRGKNGCVIVPGAGPHTFLAEILTDLRIAPDIPSSENCRDCGACVKACPTGALRNDGTIDSRRCLSFLSIEHRGDFSREQRQLIRENGILFGCDRCLSVCPEGEPAGSGEIEEFNPLPQTLSLSAREAAGITDEEFREKFRHSPLWRVKAEGLRRNASALLSDKNE